MSLKKSVEAWIERALMPAVLDQIALGEAVSVPPMPDRFRTEGFSLRDSADGFFLCRHGVALVEYGPRPLGVTFEAA